MMPGKKKKRPIICIRIYTGVLKTSPVESLYLKAYDPPLVQRKNELKLRFLYKLRSNATYTEFLRTLDYRDNQDYEENKGASRPTGVHLRKMEQI